MGWLINNWEFVLAGFYIAEKVVKLTPPTLTIKGFPVGKYDDILVDGLRAILTKLVTGKKK